jgi:uncharacterized membrane protein
MYLKWIKINKFSNILCHIPCSMVGVVDVVSVLVSVNWRLIEVAVIMSVGGAVRRWAVCCVHMMFVLVLVFLLLQFLYKQKQQTTRETHNNKTKLSKTQITRLIWSALKYILKISSKRKVLIPFFYFVIKNKLCYRRTTNRKVVGSIPDGVTGIFQWLNPSGRIVALGSTQPLTEMSTRNPFWG